MPKAKNANTSEHAGPATSSQRGWRSLRSIRTRILTTRHHQAELLDARLGARGLADDRTLVHDRDPVGERQDLVEILAEQEDGNTVRGRIAQVRVPGLDGGHVEPARRRGGED